ncbi:MAG: SDR family NAD(P)-dependent oxidoreductase [Flavobacteriaceae bacterium]|jgi:acyl transferase domain-containing protein/NAD(P)H-dependent flavin oxidoreductase YrpB (nitropropane dioxygenase family)/NAD(P)-dependent dehydrogenase (short-subunit alcohol dehydrogenase family)/acyl carrier protein|nr:SDR family NAD(P)-dependent oxidoreductase [Flavobacteriaceae bacterium]
MKKRLLVLSPFEIPDTRLAIETINAGAFPILHLGRDAKLAKKELEDLTSRTGESFGVCIVSETIEGFVFPQNVTKVLVPFGYEVSKNKFLNKNVEVLYQVHSFQEAEEAIKRKLSAIVIKGNEGAGKVSEESSFILFQKIMKKYPKSKTSLFIQGGAGLHSSSAFIALGAEGVIFDSQVILFSECSAPREIKNICSKLSGSETIIVDNFRVLHRSNSPVLPDHPVFEDVLPYLGGFDLSNNYLPLGQDMALSVDLVERYKKLKNLVNYFHQKVYGHLRQAKKVKVIFPENKLAKELGIKYPIAQGPMARVSDVPEFLNNVADSGGLPFFALSLLSGTTAQDLLNKTSEILGEKPWGVGMLGFVPSKLREVQTKYILEAKPPVVLIAGGRPSLAKPFEKEGIKVFLHVPSSALLDMCLKEGSRNFIFEGRESGGHVGPLLSLVLWEKQINKLAEVEEKSSLNIFFAGGIHDDFSSAFVSIMSVSLVAKGAKVGVLMGTSYLYTEEAVKSGAIVEEYQKQLISKNETILLESAPGQETRSIKSPFTDYFITEKKKLLSSGLSPHEILMKLEDMNVGRLRIASKGIERQNDKLVKISTREQKEKGLYMAGEVTSLINKVTTIEKLHTNVAVDSNKLIEKLEESPRHVLASNPIDIAIVGMECIFPEARNLEEYWRNIYLGKDCMSEVPDTRWNKELFYNPDTRDTDYVGSKWGGFIPTIDFDPMEFGMTPQSLASIEPVQLLSLLVAKRALKDAGYDNLSEIDSDYTSVIFGAEGATELATLYSLRASAKQFFGELPDEVKNSLPRLNSDSFAGVLSNVISGRVANRLNLGGRNFTVDAACASSLAALDIGCQELYSYRSDMVLLGGSDLHNGINDFLFFASTYALSKKGFCATFDSESDGIALGEGIGVLVLKRLADAERDGNKIYAVIKGVGGSSDGKNLGMTAPSKKGQFKALERAYQVAGISPLDVGLVEAHGTGTMVGDKAELSALTDLFLESGAGPRHAYLGSVKTQIGHAKCAAGIAGVIKAALSVYHGIIPPTIHLNKPLPIYDFETSPFIFNSKPGLWNKERRIAGVSAFGFGGTNFHAVIENYNPSISESTILKTWPSELFVFRGDTLQTAKEQVRKVIDLLQINDTIKLKDIAYSLAAYSNKDIQISVVAENEEQLLSKLEDVLEDKETAGIYYRKVREGKTAFVFSGQGSQRVNMARDLFVAFPSMRRLLNKNKEYESVIFPEAVFDDESKKQQRINVTNTQNAQPLLGIVDLAIAEYLDSLGIKADMVAGHSYGELAALCFAGAFDSKNLVSLSRERALVTLEAIGEDKGKMAAVTGISEEELQQLLEGETEVWAVNYNSSKQIVLAGTSPGIEKFLKKASDKGVVCKEINVACAFHSPLVSKSKELYKEKLKDVKFKKPKVQAWSNTTAEIYPVKAEEIKNRLAEHLVSPVLFAKQVKNMYAEGARIFIETGPGRVLTGFVQDTLTEEGEVVAIQTEGTGNDGVSFLLRAIAQYIQTGREINFEKLFEGRDVSYINIDTPSEYEKKSTIWYINGHNALPSQGELPADGALPILEPLILIKDMRNRNSAYSREQVLMEYFDNMKSLIRNQQELIQNERDVMLGYLGQFEIAPRPTQNIIIPTVQPQQTITATPQAEVTETLPSVVQSQSTGSELPSILSLTTDEIKKIVLDIVADKTGYPVDMLGMDLDMEADLSIDSIKRMEIIAALREKINFGEDKNIDESGEGLEKMASIRTLNELISWIDEMGQELKQQGQGQGQGESQEKALVHYSELNENAEISRICFELKSYPIKENEFTSIEKQRFAITDDGQGVAAKVKEFLESKGAIANVVAATDKLTEYDGLILLNVSSSTNDYTIKDLYQLLKTTDIKELKWVYAFSDVVGSILTSEGTEELKNIQGFSGLIKTLAHEYPKINFRVVISHTLFDVADLPQVVFNELSVKEILPEIIYKGTERLRYEAQIKDLTETENEKLPLDKDSVVLVLGGAQGISPELVSQLAKNAPCHYILVGRSVRLADEEGRFSLLKTKEEIRKYLINIEGMNVPAEIEKKVQEIFKSNQIGEAISKIEKTGGKVAYKSVDVRKAADFKKLIKSVKKEYGKIDGVIHAAGILEDKLFDQKTWKSFEQVYTTKVTPLHVILDELLSELKFLVLFSSMSSAFGNVGQADYAAANSVFDLTSLSLSQKNSQVKILSFNWGPWKGAGMVSDSLENEFKKKGLSMIPLKEGGEFFVNESKYGEVPAVIAMGGKKSEIEKFLQVLGMSSNSVHQS